MHTKETASGVPDVTAVPLDAVPRDMLKRLRPAQQEDEKRVPVAAFNASL